MSPVAHMVKKFGGATNAARLLKVHLSTVSQWEIRGGRIPSKRQVEVLKIAKKLKVDIQPHHIVYGTDTP